MTMTRPTRIAAAAVLTLLLALPGRAQQGIAFGTGSDTGAPVEVESDSLTVDQTDGTAEFTGNVVIVQGETRLAAPRVMVVYNDDQSAIRTLEATGGVTLASGDDAAEAERADYDVEGGTIVMTGDVLLVQGQNTLTAQKMQVDLATGRAQMEGRVRTILQTGGN